MLLKVHKQNVAGCNTNCVLMIICEIRFIAALGVSYLTNDRLGLSRRHSIWVEIKQSQIPSRSRTEYPLHGSTTHIISLADKLSQSFQTARMQAGEWACNIYSAVTFASRTLFVAISVWQL